MICCGSWDGFATKEECSRYAKDGISYPIPHLGKSSGTGASVLISAGFRGAIDMVRVSGEGMAPSALFNSHRASAPNVGGSVGSSIVRKVIPLSSALCRAGKSDAAE